VLAAARELLEVRHQVDAAPLGIGRRLADVHGAPAGGHVRLALLELTLQQLGVGGEQVRLGRDVVLGGERARHGGDVAAEVVLAAEQPAPGEVVHLRK